MPDLVACVDFGSTFTKALLVDLGTAEVVGLASHRTTIDSDVLDGWSACRAELFRAHPAVERAPVLACSSAGGGLRIAVLGNEELVTGEAGRRVALSSGGKVVHLVSGEVDEAAVGRMLADRPDVVLLVGGTDGGNEGPVLAAARLLAGSGWSGPVVAAGNCEAMGSVAESLAEQGIPHEVADNVVPRIGVLAPEPARAAIRRVFVTHVIGGKHLSASADFLDMVHGATPDVVLTAVELLADEVGDVGVVDVGGATTDVHSVVELDPEDVGLSRQVVAPTRVTRTVEGDLGMRWSAESTVATGVELGLASRHEAGRLTAAARVRRRDPAHLPRDQDGRSMDLRLAEIAVGAALRRHAGRQQVSFGPDGRLVERNGKDLREVELLVGSGGVLRAAAPDRAHEVLATAAGADVPGGWLLPAHPRLVVDRTYVLAAAGLLAPEHTDVARALLHGLHVPDPPTTSQ